MRFEGFSFGSIRIDGSIYEHDVVIDHGEVREREKKPSRAGHRMIVFEISMSQSYAPKTARRASPSGFIRISHLLSKIIRAPSFAVKVGHFGRPG